MSVAVGAFRHMAVAVALVVSAACGQREPGLERVTFLTNYVFIGRHAPFFVGVERGFYREAGLDVEILPASGSAFVLTALEGGRADFGVAEAASVVQAIGKGVTVKAFGVFMDESTSGLASLAPYPSIETLSGRTIAASMTDSARLILPILLRQTELDTPVEWLAADPSTYASLLLSGRADLITASIDSDVPALRRVAGPGTGEVHFAAFADWGYDVYGYFLVTRADWVTGRPALVRAFADATVKAVRHAVEHPEEAARALARRAPGLTEEMALAQWRESMRALGGGPARWDGYGTAADDRLRRSIDVVSDAFALSPRPSPADVYADGFMPR